MKLSLAVPLFHPSQTSVLVNRVALAVVLIIALSVRFNSIAVPVIWYDEAYSLLLARETPARIWALTALDVHPPLYYVLLHYWVAIWGDAALPARAMSALADVGTLLLCIKLMSLISTRRATWIAALLLALLPISVRYSQEVRMYTLLGFWLMGATVALVCWARAPDRKRFAVIYVLLMSAAFYTHYFAGLCVLVHWLFWWQSRVTRNGKAISFSLWIVANLGIVLLYLPWMPHFIEQLGGTSSLGWIKPVSLHGALTLVWQFTVLGATSSESSIWYLAPFFLMLLFAVTLIVSDAGERRFNLLLVSYFFVPLIALYLIALVLPLFVPRYLVFSAPALAMITAVALDKWGRTGLRCGMRFC
ncbi:glycosyltransferase family 39 protein [Pseudomonas sp. TH08]|uniref:glycosyltransferase family 39 protein n=1 Tax=Pseudomonas sp. TH08 TaxID=2796374 RepID=UPI001913C1B8|nr:glycosyltransferase family 39 protein [Pseudomonas sp. TH08]MBK5533512.1 glycosyltransferase family 39 protein [Pseudomonas sp. TH08]